MLGDHNTWGVFWKILYYFKNGLCTSGRCPMAITVSWEAAAEVFGLLRKGLPAAVKGETIRFLLPVDWQERMGDVHGKQQPPEAWNGA